TRIRSSSCGDFHDRRAGVLEKTEPGASKFESAVRRTCKEGEASMQLDESTGREMRPADPPGIGRTVALGRRPPPRPPGPSPRTLFPEIEKLRSPALEDPWLERLPTGRPR